MYMSTSSRPSSPYPPKWPIRSRLPSPGLTEAVSDGAMPEPASRSSYRWLFFFFNYLPHSKQGRTSLDVVSIGTFCEICVVFSLAPPQVFPNLSMLAVRMHRSLL